MLLTKEEGERESEREQQRGRGKERQKFYWIWQADEDVAWQHMQVGLTDFGGMRSRSSSSGISSSLYPSFSSWMFRSWFICCEGKRTLLNAITYFLILLNLFRRRSSTWNVTINEKTWHSSTFFGGFAVCFGSVLPWCVLGCPVRLMINPRNVHAS